ncbi:MAG TPA: ATP--guanido phosphotransferase [Planctomycetota bacterium]|nr:ATP--guanido phosphotransferase [Planctomycetota bacterium]
MEPILQSLSQRVGSWLSGGGPESDVVVSTRVRLARNLRGQPFVARMTDERAEEITRLLHEKLAESEPTRRLEFQPLRSSSEVLRDVLLERFLISRELAASSFDRGVAFDPAESLSVMVNEEDHLRLQSLQAGLQLDAAFDRMVEVDRALERAVEYAFSEEWGYLTSCPTNVGTGLRVSVMLHLPGLALVPRELKKVFNVATRLNLAIRGLHGEGTQASGAFFQVSNQVTLGRTERELLDDLRDVVPKVVEFERKVRDRLVEARSGELQDRLEAAHDTLASGKPVGLDPSVAMLSSLLLGSAAGRTPRVDRGEVLRWMVLVHPGHVQGRAGKRLSPTEIDRERGAFLKDALAGNGASGNGGGPRPPHGGAS